jgi:predicted HNH restriction endonuclease
MKKISYWRMAFRSGSMDDDDLVEMFEHCKAQGIAALGYWDYKGKPIVKDCSKISEEEFDSAWREKWPQNISGRTSLRHLAYHMKRNDIIYAKQGPMIVGKGTLISGYEYDPKILKGTPGNWQHFVRVKWNDDFKPFRLVIYPHWSTVLKLEGENLQKFLSLDTKSRKKEQRDLKKIASGLKRTGKYLKRLVDRNENISPRKSLREIEVIEAQTVLREVEFRLRNRSIIKIKKMQSDFACEACGMKFERVYGEIGKGHIIAHHNNPIGKREKATKTRLEDISLLCSNCHEMVHREDPPIKISELKKRIRTHRHG